jgi:hypothetical protein
MTKAKPVWTHDECAPDAESTKEAYHRITGETFARGDAVSETDHGDALEFLMKNGYRVIFSYPGASCIYAPEAGAAALASAPAPGPIPEKAPPSELETVRAQNAALLAAVAWALGETDDFRPRADGEGAYWWRTELRARAFPDAARSPQQSEGGNDGR